VVTDRYRKGIIPKQEIKISIGKTWPGRRQLSLNKGLSPIISVVKNIKNRSLIKKATRHNTNDNPIITILHLIAIYFSIVKFPYNFII